MTTQSLEWHRDCLKNARGTLARRKSELSRFEDHLREMEEQIEFEAMQLAEAERRGMDGYDNERFLKRKRKATT
jgi:hypothetical protein